MAVCRCCDRGNKYCSKACFLVVRRAQQLEAALAYQQTPDGRAAHAARQRTYRARLRERQQATPQKVTRQGSPGEQEPAKLSFDAGECISPLPPVVEEAGAASPPPPMALQPPDAGLGEAPEVIGSARHIPPAVLAAVLAGEVVSVGLLRCDFCGQWCGPWARRDPHRRGRDLAGIVDSLGPRFESRAPP